MVNSQQVNSQQVNSQLSTLGQFNPRMLTLAREAEGLTRTALAKRLGASQAYVSKIEHGHTDPTEEFVSTITASFDRPIGFFSDTSTIPVDGVVDFFHKMLLTLPVKPLRHAHGKVNEYRLEVGRLLNSVDLDPQHVLPRVGDEPPVTAASPTRSRAGAWRPVQRPGIPWESWARYWP